MRHMLLLAVLALCGFGCRTKTEFIPQPDGSMRIVASRCVTATWEEGDRKLSIDTKRANVLHDLVQLLGIKLATSDTDMQVGQ